jgi:hypothetical protein
MASRQPQVRAMDSIQSEAGTQPRRGNALIIIAGGFLTVALSLALLNVSSAFPGIVFGPDEATRLLAIELIAVALLLVLASSGSRMRLTLQMILTYMTIYLILPGYHHSSKNIYPFYDLSYEHDIRMRAALIISLFVAALISGYLLGDHTGTRRQTHKTIAREIVFPSLPLLLTFTVVSIVAMIGYVARAGLGKALSTRAEFGGADSILEYGFLVTAPRLITFVAFAYCFVIFLRSRKAGFGLYYMLVNLIPFLICNFPLVLPRYVLFGIILFFLVQTFDFSTARARNLLTMAFLFGALFAMPVAESLTRNSNRQASTSLTEAYDYYLSSPDFDGLQSIQNAVLYTDQVGFQNGLGTLSAALFFVPRDFWESKAPPTGEVTSKAAGYYFHNISQPLPSELFVDFGWIGLVVSSAILGFWVARLDRWIDVNWHAGPRARLIAGIVVAYTIILMRGALLAIISSVVFFSAGIALIIVLGLVKAESIRIRRRRRSDGEIMPSPRVARHAKAVASNQAGRKP